jgi:hypothetical protein
MARIIDFTRQRYRGFRRGMNEDRRQINTELRQIKNRYMQPDVTIPIAGAALKGGMDIGKGLMERAAKSKAMAGMTDSARSQQEAAMQRVSDAQRQLSATGLNPLTGSGSLQRPSLGAGLGTADMVRQEATATMLGNRQVGATPGGTYGYGTPSGVGLGAQSLTGLDPSVRPDQMRQSMIQEGQGALSEAQAGLASAQRRVADLEGIQTQGLAYLQSQAQVANTAERQRELMALVATTQGPQYQGRSLGQIAAGQAPPDLAAIGQQQKLMASLFPQTQAQIDTAALAARGKVADVEKKEAEVKGIQSQNVVKDFEASVGALKKKYLGDPRWAPLISGLEKSLADIDNIESQIDRRKDQTAAEDADRTQRGRKISLEHQQFLAKLRQNQDQFDRKFKQAQEEARRKAAAGKRPPTSRAFGAGVTIKMPKNRSSQFFNQRIADPLLKTYSQEYEKMTPQQRLKFAGDVVDSLGLRKGLTTEAKDGVAYNNELQSVAMRGLVILKNAREGSKKALGKTKLATGQTTDSVAGNIMNQASKALRQASSFANTRSRLGPETGRDRDQTRADVINASDFAAELTAQFERIDQNDYNALRDMTFLLLSPQGMNFMGVRSKEQVYKKLGLVPESGTQGLN